MANAQSISISIGKRGTTVTGAMLDEYPQMVEELQAVAVANDLLESVLDGTYVPDEEENGGEE